MKCSRWNLTGSEWIWMWPRSRSRGSPAWAPPQTGFPAEGARGSPHSHHQASILVNRHRFWWYGIHALKLSVLRYTTLWWCSPDFCCTVCTSPGGISGLCINHVVPGSWFCLNFRPDGAAVAGVGARTHRAVLLFIFTLSQDSSLRWLSKSCSF